MTIWKLTILHLWVYDRKCCKKLFLIFHFFTMTRDITLNSYISIQNLVSVSIWTVESVFKAFDLYCFFHPLNILPISNMISVINLLTIVKCFYLVFNLNEAFQRNHSNMLFDKLERCYVQKEVLNESKKCNGTLNDDHHSSQINQENKNKLFQCLSSENRTGKSKHILNL